MKSEVTCPQPSLVSLPCALTLPCPGASACISYVCRVVSCLSSGGVQDGIFKAGAKRAIARAEKRGGEVSADGAGNTVSAYHLMFYVNYYAIMVLVVWLGVDYLVSNNSEVVRGSPLVVFVWWGIFVCSCSHSEAPVNRIKFGNFFTTSQRHSCMWWPSACWVRWGSCSSSTASQSSVPW